MDTLQNAYKLVYNDMVKCGGLFVGQFDAKNGNKEFMYGIGTIMEFIALNAGEEIYDDFEKIWSENFEKSLDKSEWIGYTINTEKKER